MRFYEFVRGGYGAVAAICVAIGAGFATAPPVAAQTVYDGTLDPTDQAEVVAWATLFWQRVDQGGGSPGAGFAFTKAEMNSHLFNPMRAARPTLEKVGLVAAGACDQMGIPEAGAIPEVAAVWSEYRKAMLEGKIETDWSSDPGGTIEHANLILAAPATAGLTVYVEGGKLVSENLPLEKVDQVAYEATLKFGACQQTQDIIAALIASGAQWAADAGSVTEFQKAITGEASKADMFRSNVWWLLDGLGVTGSVDEVFAQFGTYGTLPSLVVTLPDAAILIDPATGSISGPFEMNSALDARGLLSAYSNAYVAGSSIRYYSRSGKVVSSVSEVAMGDPCGITTVQGLGCTQANVNQLLCSTDTTQRCQCRDDGGGAFSWHCAPCVAPKKCVEVHPTPGTTALYCQ